MTHGHLKSHPNFHHLDGRDPENRLGGNHKPAKTGIPNRQKTGSQTRFPAKPITCPPRIQAVLQALAGLSRTTTAANRKNYEWKGLRYPSDMTVAEWALVKPLVDAVSYDAGKKIKERNAMRCSIRSV